MSFSMRMRDVVIEEERNATMTETDQERLFRKVAVYLENVDRSIGLHTIVKLAFAPATIAATRLEEMAAIICDKLFQPVAYTDDQILKYSDFYLCFAYLEATKFEGKGSKMMTFEEAFIESFLSKLAKRFKNRGNSLGTSSNPKEYEKDKGVDKNTEEQDMVVDKNSVRFLGNVRKLYPSLPLKVFEFLLSNFGDETYSYFCSLLTPQAVTINRGNQSPMADCWSLIGGNLGWNQETGLMCAVADMGKMTSGNWSTADMYRSRYLPKLLPKLRSLDDSSKKVTMLADKHLRDVALKHRLSYITFCQQATPQDFIKLTLAKIPRFGFKNDFEIDEEDKDEYRRSSIDMWSINYSPKFISPFKNGYEWCGLKVHTLE